MCMWLHKKIRIDVITEWQDMDMHLWVCALVNRLLLSILRYEGVYILILSNADNLSNTQVFYIYFISTKIRTTIWNVTEWPDLVTEWRSQISIILNRKYSKRFKHSFLCNCFCLNINSNQKGDYNMLWDNKNRNSNQNGWSYK